MSETFYKKLSNGRYEAVRIEDNNLLDSLPLGYHLVHIASHTRSRRYNVNPDFIALSAAAHSIENSLAQIISNKSSNLANALNYTEKQKEVLREITSKMQDAGIFRIYYPSNQEIAEKVVEELTKLASTTAELPAVQDISDKYKMVLALAYEQKD